MTLTCSISNTLPGRAWGGGGGGAFSKGGQMQTLPEVQIKQEFVTLMSGNM